MRESIKTFPEIKNFKQHSHDCVVWKMAFEKELRSRVKALEKVSVQDMIEAEWAILKELLDE